MFRRALVFGVAFLVTACGGASPATPSATPAQAITAPQGAGLTLTSTDSGAANLDGGRYRVAWDAPGCTSLAIAWHNASGSTPVDVTLPSGQTFVQLPGGVGVLDRQADCDYVVRFEAAP